MNEARQRVADLIRYAFEGVTLGNGVGLRQAQGLDDYAGKEELAVLRSLDEKDDWISIPDADLDRCYSSLSFFDAEGMRFHLPSYMLAGLSGQIGNSSVVFHLTYFEHGNLERMSLLNDRQREAVRQYLWLLMGEAQDFDSEHPDIALIENALLNYWGMPDDFSK